MTHPTPMLKQYRELKARHPDALLLYRLGDFYELFEEDAKLVSRQLGLILTKRRFSKNVHLPMCGIPHHRLDSYLARLIKLGHKVAIVEQLEDARKTRRLVKRGVVRIITPGTVVEDTLLADREERLLVGVLQGNESTGRAQGYGLSSMDLSTGEFSATQIDVEAALWEELSRLSPSEIVLPRSLASDPTFIARLDAIHPSRLSPIDDTEFDSRVASERLMSHLGVLTLEGFGCDGLPLAISAAGAVLHYLQSNQISDLNHIVRLKTYDLAAYMSLDEITRRNLELTRTLRDGRRNGSLNEKLDRTLTAMGGRMLRRWLSRPLLNVKEIHDRQDAVSELVEHAMQRASLGSTLDGLHDVERLVGRIGFGNANARDLTALRQALERIPRIKALLAQAQSARLQNLGKELDTTVLQRIATLIATAIADDPPILLREGGLIRPGYDQELERLRDIAGAGRDWLTEFEAQERERTGIKNLRVRYNQVFGFFIEVTKSNLHRVPSDYERRATITHAERFMTAELRARETEILSAEERLKELEYELFVRVRQSIAAESATLTQAARVLAELDTLTSLAKVAALNNYVRPVVDEGDIIDIREGRHPVVEHTLPDGERFVPNDTALTRDQRLLILTGPNMSGKSVYIRQTALIVLLAQIGSFVPAVKAHIGAVDRIFVRAGASDDITQGRSTFLVEMSETAHILRHATQRSLVVLDEVGRGTSTYDGMSIAWAVAEELHDVIGARTLFATHFHELTHLVEQLPAARNYTLAITEQGRQIIFLRQLVPGGADKSYGIQVARLAGLPDRVTNRAEQVLSEFEQAERTQGERLQAKQPLPIKEAALVWAADEHLLRSADAATVRAILSELYHLNIANTTPVQALVALNKLQIKLGK